MQNILRSLGSNCIYFASMTQNTLTFCWKTLLNEFDRTPAEPQALGAGDHRPGGQSPTGKGGRPGLVLQPEAEGEEDDPSANRGRRVSTSGGAGQRGRPPGHRAGGGAPRPPGPLSPGAPAAPPGSPPPHPAGPEPVLAGGQLVTRLGPRAAAAAQSADDVPLAAPPRTAVGHPAAA